MPPRTHLGPLGSEGPARSKNKMKKKEFSWPRFEPTLATNSHSMFCCSCSVAVVPVLFLRRYLRHYFSLVRFSTLVFGPRGIASLVCAAPLPSPRTCTLRAMHCACAAPFSPRCATVRASDAASQGAAGRELRYSLLSLLSAARCCCCVAVMSAPVAVSPTGADVSKNANNPVLALKEADLRMMLAAKVHLGTKVSRATKHASWGMPHRCDAWSDSDA